MARWNRALVTGASSGIGKAIAERLAADGTELVLVARNEDRLSGLADKVEVACGRQSEVLVADLADPAALSRVEDRLRDATDERGPIDLLVNSAGFGFAGPFEHLDLEREAAVVDVNVVAVHRLCHVAVTAMMERGTPGGILNVSSMVAFMASPDGATYAATKSFVNSLSESLHTQLKPNGIHVTALCPGFTRTEFQARADYDTSKIPDRLWQSADEVAEAGLVGVSANKAIVVPGKANRASAVVLNTLPSRVRRFAMSKLPG